MDLTEHPTFLMVFFGVWLLAGAYIGSVFLLSSILAGERRRGERVGGPVFPSPDPMQSLAMLKFILAASPAKGESARVMKAVWLVRALFFLSGTGILGVMAWTVLAQASAA